MNNRKVRCVSNKEILGSGQTQKAVAKREPRLKLKSSNDGLKVHKVIRTRLRCRNMGVNL